MHIDPQPQDTHQETPSPSHTRRSRVKLDSDDLQIFVRQERRQCQLTCSMQPPRTNDLDFDSSNDDSLNSVQQWSNIIQHKQLLLSRRSQRKTLFTQSCGRAGMGHRGLRVCAHLFVLCALLLCATPDCAIICASCCFAHWYHCLPRLPHQERTSAVQRGLRLHNHAHLALITSSARSSAAAIFLLQLLAVLSIS